MIEIIDEIIDGILIESKSNPILKNNEKALETISYYLNGINLGNKKMNTLDIYGYCSHEFILANEKDEYYLIDLCLDEVFKDEIKIGKKCIQIDQETYNEYTKKLGIVNEMSLKELYSQRFAK